MAQSRMAGMAMDLGPDDLADVGEAATLATNKMGMEQGQQAGVSINLDRDTITMVNDGKPEVGYRGMGKGYYDGNSPDQAYPIPGGYGAVQQERLTPGLRRHAARVLHEDGFYMR